MLQRYKEVFYGLLFGLGASVIDVFMHASMEQQGFWMELIHPQPIMVAYRVFFIAFGLALGWLLWRKNKVERDFRSLAETVEQFRRGISAPAVLNSYQTPAIADSRRFPSSTRSARDDPVRLRKIAGDRRIGRAKVAADKGSLSICGASCR